MVILQFKQLNGYTIEQERFPFYADSFPQKWRRNGF